MVRTHCIFCPNPLDGSDEHLIPESIKGRLHSKQLICSECNTKKFGSQVDPIVKEIFKMTLHILGFSNSRKIEVKDPEGNKYISTFGKGVKKVKPELTVKKEDGLVYISATGELKDTVKLFAKHAVRYIRHEKDLDNIIAKQGIRSVPPLSAENEINISPTLILELNKIALEYFALNDLPLEPVSTLLKRVSDLDTSLNNITFCNWSHEVRITENTEISHLIIVRSDSNTKILYCYIELFNIVCAFIPLIKNYDGEHVDITYHQDVMSGERFTEPIELNLDIASLLNERETLNQAGKFDFLLAQFADRKKTREFRTALDRTLDATLDKLNLDVKNGDIAKEDLGKIYLKDAAKVIAELTLDHYPYIVEDTSDEQLSEINYIHSNLFDVQFEKFCELNHRLIGREIYIEDDDLYVADSFFKQPTAQIREHKIIKVYCVLRNKNNCRLIYIPYRVLFESLTYNPHFSQENIE